MGYYGITYISFFKTNNAIIQNTDLIWIENVLLYFFSLKTPKNELQKLLTLGLAKPYIVLVKATV